MNAAAVFYSACATVWLASATMFYRLEREIWPTLPKGKRRWAITRIVAHALVGVGCIIRAVSEL